VKGWKNTKNEILRLRKEEGDESGVTSRSVWRASGNQLKSAPPSEKDTMRKQAKFILENV
jgi:hypothetical protein